MKRKSFLYVLITFLGFSALSSCSNDDGNEPDSSELPSGKCRITSANCETIDYDDPDYGWITYYSNFKFDSNGQIESYTTKLSDDRDYTGKEHYSYSSNFIRVEDEDGATIVRYNLENGLIATGEDRWGNSWSYIYDNDNHIIKIIDGNRAFSCTWKEGNLISFTMPDNTVMNVSYTNNSNTLSFLPIGGFSSDDRMIDNILCSEGYFGKMPNNLPSAITGKDDLDRDYANKISYNDFNKYGYPQTLKLDYYYSSQLGYSETYHFEWSN